MPPGRDTRLTPPPRRLDRLLAQAVQDLAGLLLPVECPGCGAWDVELCPACRGLLAAAPVRCEANAPALDSAWGGRSALPVWSVVAYVGAVRGIVLAWKGQGGRRLAGAMAEAGRSAGEAWGTALVEAGCEAGVDVVVVPAPSGWRRRASGRFVVRALARHVADGLIDAGPAGVAGRCVVADVLRRRTGRAHQTGLGASGRSLNRRRSMRLVRPLPPGSACLLLDDVLTTGATLEECRRVLTEAGHQVLGALVLAATPRRPPVW